MLAVSQLSNGDNRVAARSRAYHSNDLTNEYAPSRESAEGISMPQNRERVSRNNRRQSGRNVRAYTITQLEYQARVQGAMREYVGPGPGGAKKIASEIECNEKTAQNWLDGKTTPSGILDLRAMNAIPTYAALKREIAGMETDMDPRVQAKLHELYRMTLQLADGNNA